MYYITPKNSDTGRKFQEIEAQGKIALEAQIKLAKKHGFNTWRSHVWAIFGGISSCRDFNETPDPKVWGKGLLDGEYFPKQSSIKGKAIADEIDNLPKVFKDQLNACVGYEDIRNSIGFAFSNDEYFGFTIAERWNHQVPADCEEVNSVKYYEIVKPSIPNPIKEKKVTLDHLKELSKKTSEFWLEEAKRANANLS